MNAREILGKCTQCGNCCRDINLQNNDDWIYSEEQYQDFLKKHPQYERFQISGKDSDGALKFSCTWLQEDNTCKDHKNRLEICDLYPDHFSLSQQSKDSECGYYLAPDENAEPEVIELEDDIDEDDDFDEAPPKPLRIVFEEYYYDVKEKIKSAFSFARTKPSKSFSIEGSCAQCGECCREINIEGSSGWLKTKEEFESFCEQNPKFERFLISGQKNGYLTFNCTWLMEDNSCKDHKNRLEICKKYPVESVIDDEATLHDSCGYYKKYHS